MFATYGVGMKTIRLYGPLGTKFGKVHRFAVSTPSEAIRALMANFNGFKQFLMESEEKLLGYRIVTGNQELSVEELSYPAGSEIRIIPCVIGASASTRILLGAVIIAAVTIVTEGSATPAMASFASAGSAVGYSLVIGGIAQLLSPPPPGVDLPERPENTPSNNFSGPVNTEAQGHPVPLLYGRLTVGSAIISAGINIDQIKQGYKIVMVPATVDIQANDYPENLMAPPPANFYRQELLEYYNGGVTQTWRFRFYYYIETRVLA